MMELATKHGASVPVSAVLWTSSFGVCPSEVASSCTCFFVALHGGRAGTCGLRGPRAGTVSSILGGPPQALHARQSKVRVPQPTRKCCSEVATPW